MTPGNNGASTPEDDDPFGYLYADGQARGAQPPTGSYGYPNAVNRVRPVGERQYGQQTQQTQQAPQAPTAQYGQVPQQGYGQQNAHYQAPESFPGGSQPTRQQGYGGGGGRGRGPNTKGLLIGAIAVVAAVVIGIGVAMLGDDSENASGNSNDTGASSSATGEESTAPSPSASKSAEAETGELPKAEAKTLLLGGTAATASDISGAKSDGGFYVTNFNSVGSSITWKAEDVPESGKYTLYVLYGVPGKNADATLTVNGTAQGRPLNLSNFAKAPEGDYEKGWTNTYASIQLNKGSNEIKISCEQGNSCDVNFDQLYLEEGWKS